MIRQVLILITLVLVIIAAILLSVICTIASVFSIGFLQIAKFTNDVNAWLYSKMKPHEKNT